MTTSTQTPAVYIADLADYNAGILRGFWLEVENITLEEMSELIHSFLKEKGHEEWVIHDYEYLPSSLGEYPSLEEVIKVAGYVSEYGYEVISGYLEYYGIEDLDRFSETYVGTYDSETDYAYEFIDECYEVEKMMGNLSVYFNYEAFARDLFIDSFVSFPAVGNKVAVFSRL